MAGYPGLQRITDENIRTVCKNLFDQIHTLQAQVTALQAAALQKTTDYDAGGRKISNLALGTADTDAVTLKQLRETVDAVKKAIY